jgi:hypothetical protein
MRVLFYWSVFQNYISCFSLSQNFVKKHIYSFRVGGTMEKEQGMLDNSDEVSWTWWRRSDELVTDRQDNLCSFSHTPGARLDLSTKHGL